MLFLVRSFLSPYTSFGLSSYDHIGLLTPLEVWIPMGFVEFVVFQITPPPGFFWQVPQVKSLLWSYLDGLVWTPEQIIEDELSSQIQFPLCLGLKVEDVKMSIVWVYLSGGVWSTVPDTL